MLKIKDKLHGFTVTKVTEIPEIGGRAVMMLHEKSGCKLCFIDRPDVSKSFAISFNTIPEDDTGVFHILEHSVLCGSTKFPVKEPFTELLKCSLNTFLNALTYSDKTAYPLSSRNERDFLNMVDIYLDAVFHPIAKKDPRIFAQEGHRYEFGKDGELTVNGVVYNEMKGAYSAPDELAAYYVGQRLFPGTAYAYDSGGNPDAIPELDFEEFKAMHDKYYHPSEATVYLDGGINLDTALPLIRSYLDEFDRREAIADVGEPLPLIEEPLIAEYEIDESDDPKDKTRIFLAYRAYDYTEREKNFALSVIADTIADGNSSKLKAAVLSHGLMENISFYPSTSQKLGAFNVEMQGVKDGCEEEAIAAFKQELAKIIDGGIPEDQLSAALGAAEFRAREADFGSYPKGIVYIMNMLEVMPYGGEAADALAYNDLFDSLRARVGTGYFTDLLREIFIDKPSVTVILHPSADLCKRRDEARRERLAGILSAMSEEQKAALKEECEDFAAWQAKPDSVEALATIPRLTLEDLDTEIQRTPIAIEEKAGVKVIIHDMCSGGISYIELWFDASDLCREEMLALRIITASMEELDSTEHTSIERGTLIKGRLGELNMTMKPIKRKGDARLYMLVTLCALDTRLEDAAALTEELIYKTVYRSPEVIKRKLAQLKPAMEEAVSNRGSSYAIMRTAARYDDSEYLKELLFGYEYCKYLAEANADKEKAAEKIISYAESARERIFVRKRLTVAATGEKNTEVAGRLLDIVRKGGEECTAHFRGRLPMRNEGIVIPSSVSYAVRGSNLSNAGFEYTGALATLGNVLNYAVLWGAVRVSGGAYGTGFYSRGNSGTVGAYSFRDPSPAASLRVFSNMGEQARAFLKENPDLTDYIVGTVGAADPITTPRSEGASSTLFEMTGKSQDELYRTRQQIISTTEEELYALSELLDTLDKTATNTVIGPRDTLATIEGLDEILSL